MGLSPPGDECQRTGKPPTQQVFLSYTCSPHVDYVAETDALRRNVTTLIESMDLRVVTGEDLGGGVLTPEVIDRIENADAVSALVSPWEEDGGPKSEYCAPCSPALLLFESAFVRYVNQTTRRVRTAHAAGNSTG